jgi:hypothetical protein
MSWAAKEHGPAKQDALAEQLFEGYHCKVSRSGSTAELMCALSPIHAASTVMLVCTLFFAALLSTNLHPSLLQCLTQLSCQLPLTVSCYWHVNRMIQYTA